jgi:protein phosphatase
MTSGAPLSNITFSGAGMTHPGKLRDRNEDAILLDPSGQLWVVADGMGGHGHGDVAAEMVVDGLALIDDEGPPEATLRAQILRINSDIYEVATRNGNMMGATLVVAFLEAGAAHFAWVGDSRIYMWRGGALRQISRDHSRVQELIDDGFLTPEAARVHPERNVITRAMGADATVEADFLTIGVKAGDRIMLCSDGLTTCVTDDVIADMVTAYSDPETAASALVKAALDAGAPDNVSVIVITATEG